MQEWIQEIQRSLSERFLADILRFPEETGERLYRLNNYMSGHNGLYLYKPGTDYAYLPDTLSGTFYLGKWAFLGTPEMIETYNKAIEHFPISIEEAREICNEYPRMSYDWSEDNIYKPENVFAYPFTLVNGFQELCCLCTQILF